MRAEHCESEDSRETFQPYEGVDELTTSQAEWDFVVSLTTVARLVDEPGRLTLTTCQHAVCRPVVCR